MHLHLLIIIIRVFIVVLVEQGHFKDPKFVAYLQYLLYLSQPPYTTLFSYPNSVAILRLLCREEFRRQLLEATGPIIDYIHKQQYHHWVNLGNTYVV